MAPERLLAADRRGAATAHGGDRRGACGGTSRSERMPKGRPTGSPVGAPSHVRQSGAQPLSSAATSSAICTAFSAAPLRRLSLETNRARPLLDRLVAADAAHVGRVLAGRLERGGDVGEDHAGGVGQQLVARSAADRAGEAGVDLQGVPGEDRDAHAGAGDLELRDLQDLAGLVAELLLLVGLVQSRRPRSSRRAGSTLKAMGRL